MLIDHDKLVFKALCALDEAVAACHDAAIKPTFALRFALAYLFAVSDGKRDSFDDFWRQVQDPQARAYSDDAGQYMRVTHARIALTGISRSVGIELTSEVMARLRKARDLKRGTGQP